MKQHYMLTYVTLVYLLKYSFISPMFKNVFLEQTKKRETIMGDDMMSWNSAKD